MGAVTTAFVQQYKDMIKLLVQQKGSKLRDTVELDTNIVGEFKFYDQLGATDMVEKTTRHQDTPIIDPDHKRRRLTTSDFIHNTLLDKEDQLKMIVDPKSSYARTAVMSAGRKIDDIIIAAFGGTAATGKTGTGTADLAAANKVIVDFDGDGTDEGLTKEKLIEAKRILDTFDVEEEDRHLALHPTQLANLLNTTEATSSDFNTVKALVAGELNTWLGFVFHKTTRLTLDASSDRLVYAYSRAGLQLGKQKEPTVRIDERPDKNYAWQVFLSLSLGAVRLEEERVVQIACAE